MTKWCKDDMNCGLTICWSTYGRTSKRLFYNIGMYEYIRKFAAMFIHKDLRVCLRDVQETVEYKGCKTSGITPVVPASGSFKSHIILRKGK